MSIKEDVFTFIEKNPEMSLDQIVDGLPELKKTSVRKYYYDHRKLKQGGAGSGKKAVGPRKKKKSGSIRQQVYDLLDKNPDSTIDTLCGAIEGCNRKTIRDYRNRWRKDNLISQKPDVASPSVAEVKTDSDDRGAVYKFLHQNPKANLNDLKKRFPDNNKLVTDFRSWKLEQSEKLKEARQAAEDTVANHLSVDSYKETIDSLKQVIEKQKSTIETQRSKLKQFRAQLSQTKIINLDGLKTFIANKLLKK